MVVLLYSLVFLLIALDLCHIVRLINRLTGALSIFLFSHLLFLTDLFFRTELKSFYGAFLLLLFYLSLKISLRPIKRNKSKNLRLRAMLGGREIIIFAWISIIFEVVFYIAVLFNKGKLFGEGYKNVIFDLLVCIFITICFFYNGCLRVILTSKWLSVIKRAIAFFLLPIPLVNIFISWYLCHTAFYEFQYFSYKLYDEEVNQLSDMCETKYPILMIHGIGFRDFKLFNYWGRIPRQLERLGAKIYYANQEALGTIEYNAEDIRKRIFEIMEENNCSRVNIIAHSKGGLDARYAISVLGMEDYVASLTTISSPHRGVKMVDYLCHLPDGLYRFVAKIFDSYFKRLGDKNPNFYEATRAFSTEKSKEFNKRVNDSEKVFYQSYTTVLKSFFSDYILCIPYVVIKRLEGENDGLVSINSAKWGEFKGVIRSEHLRGISHGDIIDLKREDYRGFDVVNWYVGLISDMKKKGF